MKVFISYGHQNFSLVSAIVPALKKMGIDSVFDKEFVAGDLISKEVIDKISSSDAVLVIISNYSANSPWVNQEVGVAIALNRKIVPLVIDNNSTFGGGITSTLKAITWGRNNLEDVIQLISNSLNLAKPALGAINSNLKYQLKKVICGKLNRTNYIISKIKETLERIRNIEKKEEQEKVIIYEQAAFSTMGIPDDFSTASQAGFNDLGQWKALKQQNLMLKELIAEDNVEYNMMLNPNSSRYKSSIFNLREQTLTKWYEKADTQNWIDKGKIKIQCDTAADMNIFVINECFAASGYSKGGVSDYDITIIDDAKEEIIEIVNEINNAFRSSVDDPRSGFKLFKERCQELQLGAANE
ncbi:toll/interleukin-1 receptor domain-containing protein [candidate division KSB1 bacterium]|nr:toll/interleukin-1 receptor domain-containing protein [candidate division KSB1 bacterium]